MILKAIKFATEKHEGQFRKVSGKPYINHPILVSYILTNYKKSKHIEELICASILHDTLEDIETSFLELATEFTPLVASLVLELTNDDVAIKAIGKLEYLKKKLLGISNYALIIKLADRLANLKDNPTTKTIEDTIVLMKHLEYNRDLTKPQRKIYQEIVDTAKTHL